MIFDRTAPTRPTSPLLDRGDPEELGRLYKELKPHLGAVRVIGGCCGTGTPHIASICERWLAGD